MGILIAYDPGMRILGGDQSAKSFWKYHRELPFLMYEVIEHAVVLTLRLEISPGALGYLILPITLITVSTAITTTKFVQAHSTVAERSLMTAGLGFIAAGLWSGITWVQHMAEALRDTG